MVGGFNGIENGAWWVIIDEIRVGAQSHKKSRFRIPLFIILVTRILSNAYYKGKGEFKDVQRVRVWVGFLKNKILISLRKCVIANYL